MCDDSGDGIIDEAELYAGLLLVHLNLAKYAGPAACYPPTRKVCDRLFHKADRDRSGGIDRTEFQYIVGVLCAQIMSRMMVYYIVLILCVPIVATCVVTTANIPKDTYLELATRESVSCVMFFLAIPLLWNTVDARYSGGGVGIGSIGDSDSDNDIVNDDYAAAQTRNSKNTMEDDSMLLLPPSRRKEQRQRRRQRKSQQQRQRQRQRHQDDDEIAL